MRDYSKIGPKFWIDENGQRQRVLASRRLDYSQSGPLKLKEFVLRRDGSKCVICGRADELVIDHCLSLKNGGSNHPENLRCLCSTCNARKVGLFDARNAFSSPHVAAPSWVAWRDGDSIRFGAIFPDRSVSFSLPATIAKDMAEAFLHLLRKGADE